MNLSDEARKKRNEYQRRYNKKNRDKINEYYKGWRHRNPDKIKKYNEQYWERKALKEFDGNDVTLNDTLNDSVTRCINCGNRFEPKRKTAKFCCASCRVKYNRK